MDYETERAHETDPGTLATRELLTSLMNQTNEIDAFTDHAKYIADTILPMTRQLLLIARGEIIRLSNENERLRERLTATAPDHEGEGDMR